MWKLVKRVQDNPIKGQCPPTKMVEEPRNDVGQPTQLATSIVSQTQFSTHCCLTLLSAFPPFSLIQSFSLFSFTWTLLQPYNWPPMLQSHPLHHCKCVPLVCLFLYWLSSSIRMSIYKSHDLICLAHQLYLTIPNVVSNACCSCLLATVLYFL